MELRQDHVLTAHSALINLPLSTRSTSANLQSLVQGPKEQILHIQCVLNRPSNGLGTDVAIADVGALPWSPRLAVSTGDVGSDRLFTAAM